MANKKNAAKQVIEQATSQKEKLTFAEKRKKLADAKRDKKNRKKYGNAINPPDTELNKLLLLYQNKQYADAETLAVSLAKIFPNHPLPYKVLGFVLKQTGRIIDSLIPMQKSVQLAPQDTVAHYNLGNTLKELGRLDEAHASYTQAIALKPDFTEAHSNLGNTLKELGKLDEARASYTQAIALKPDFAEARNNLGITLFELGRLDEAEASYRQTIKLKPDYAEAHSNMGITLKQLGRLDESLASHTQAIALNPDYAEAHNNLGLTLQELGRLGEAHASYTQAIALKPEYAEAHSNLGNTLRELGRLNEAVASYTQAIALKPGFAKAHSNLGTTQQLLGRLAEAIASFTQAITLQPDYAEAVQNLVKLPVGQLGLETLDLCEKALVVQSATDKNQASYHFSRANLLKHRGLLLKHKGLTEQSFDEFRKANKLKWQEVREEFATKDSENTEDLNRIRQWTPNVPELVEGGLTKLFLMGPSRSGKSSLEHLLNKSSQVKPLYEAINYSGFEKDFVNEKISPETPFEKLFYQTEDDFLTQGYKTVTSTRPGSLYYSDHLIDMLPNTYFIIINRDLRDVAAEIFTTEYTKGNFYAYDPNEISTYLSAYNKFCEALVLKVPDRCITISFENIINSPEETIEKIGGLVGLNFEVGSLNKDPTSFTSKSLFRDHFAAINKSS